MDDQNEVELLQYREKVLAELERREIRLREIDEQMAQLQGALDVTRQGRRVMMGATARIQVEAAHKAKQREVLRGLAREREVALIDVQKAEVRLQEVDMQLDELRSDHSESE